MNIDSMFTSRWLKADDIEALADENTETATLVMDRVEMAEVGNGQEEKPVLYFKGQQLGLILNKTNANTISALYGKITEAWAGKPIGLFTTEVDFQGKQSLGIRVRMKAPKAAKPTAKPVTVPEDDETPF